MKVMHGMVGLGLVLSGVAAFGQATVAPPASSTETPKASEPARSRPDLPLLPVQVFYFANVSQPNDGNEVSTAVRNLLPPSTKIYFVPSQSALFVQGTPEQIALAQTVVHDLDRPKKLFRLTYTISEMDGGKRISSQHFAMMAADGQRVTLKQGSKVPIATGSYSSGATTGVQTQFQYLDVGMNFDATPSSEGNGARLKTKVEQSSVAEEKAVSQVREPVIRQATLEGTSLLTFGKTLLLGSLDIPGSTSHLDVEVMIEQIP